jgi:hypothetical protein
MNQDIMNQDSIANDVDAKLSRLFAEKNEQLPADPFMSQLLPRLERAYRVQLIRSVMLVAVVLLLGALLAPFVVRVTTELFSGLFSFTGQVKSNPVMDSVFTAATVVAALIFVLWSRKKI